MNPGRRLSVGSRFIPPGPQDDDQTSDWLPPFSLPHKSIMGDLFTYAAPHDRMLIALGLGINTMTGCLLPVCVLFSGRYLDGAQDKSYSTVNLWCGLQAAAGLACFVLGWLGTTCLEWAAENQVTRLKANYFHAYLNQDEPYRLTFGSGGASEILETHSAYIRIGIGSRLGQLFILVSQFVSGFIVAMTQHVKLTLVLSGMIPVLLLGGGFTLWSVAYTSEKQHKNYSRAAEIFQEAVANIVVVISNGLERLFVGKYDDAICTTAKASSRGGLLLATGMGLSMGSLFAFYALGFWAQGKFLADSYRDGCIPGETEPGCLTVGKGITVFFCIAFGSFAFGQCAPPLSALVKARESYQILLAVIDRPSRMPVFGNIPDVCDTPEIKGHVEFVAVAFAYARSDGLDDILPLLVGPSRSLSRQLTRMTSDLRAVREATKAALTIRGAEEQTLWVFSGFNLTAQPGESVALVGPSGCGKSTVARLLLRFADPTEGSIRFDGIDSRSINIRHLRDAIGYVGQEPQLFDDTIANNILMGNPRASFEDAVRAAKMAQAHTFIEAFPAQYDTMVGEGGCRLSGGQKQRIAIARALIRRPKILVLDEATSALDTTTEAAVQKQIEKFCRENCTTLFVVAHRLSTIRLCNKIIVFQTFANIGDERSQVKSFVIERGDHLTLMAKDGFYKSLVGRQDVTGNYPITPPSSRSGSRVLTSRSSHSFSTSVAPKPIIASPADWLRQTRTPSPSGRRVRRVTYQDIVEAEFTTPRSKQPVARHQLTPPPSFVETYPEVATPLRDRKYSVQVVVKCDWNCDIEEDEEESVAYETARSKGVSLFCSSEEELESLDSAEPEFVSDSGTTESRPSSEEPIHRIQLSSLMSGDESDSMLSTGFDFESRMMELTGRHFACLAPSDSTTASTTPEAPLANTFPNFQEQTRPHLTKTWRFYGRNIALQIVGVAGAAANGLVFPLFAWCFADFIGVLSLPSAFEIEAGIMKPTRRLLYVSLFCFLANFVQFAALEYAGAKLVRNVRHELADHILHLPLSFFKNQKLSPGYLSRLLAADCLALKNWASAKVATIVQVLSSFIMATIIASDAHVRLAMISLIGFLAMFPAVYLQQKFLAGTPKKKDPQEQNLDVIADRRPRQTTQEILAESTCCGRTIDAFNLQEFLAAEYDAALVKERQSGRRRAVIGGFFFGLSQFCQFGAQALNLWIGGRAYIQDEISDLGQMIQATFTMIIAALGIGQATSGVSEGAEGKQSARRIESILSVEVYPDVRRDEGYNPRKRGGTSGGRKPTVDIEVNNLEFHFPPVAPGAPTVPIYEGLRLSIPQGTRIAVVGESGCGKSTLFTLLERFYELPSSRAPQLSVGGVDVREWNVQALRNRIALVSQDPYLFDDTIAANIRYGNPCASWKQMKEAAAKAEALEFILELPEGFMTRVGPGGLKLSGGQRQKVAIARAFVRNADILLLDEATAALDAESESKILRTWMRKPGGRGTGPTVIFVAHRLSLVRDCDLIVVLKKRTDGLGSYIAEQGTHEALMKSRTGAYRKLVNSTR